MNIKKERLRSLDILNADRRYPSNFRGTLYYLVNPISFSTLAISTFFVLVARI